MGQTLGNTNTPHAINTTLLEEEEEEEGEEEGEEKRKRKRNYDDDDDDSDHSVANGDRLVIAGEMQFIVNEAQVIHRTVQFRPSCLERIRIVTGHSGTVGQTLGHGHEKQCVAQTLACCAACSC